MNDNYKNNVAMIEEVILDVKKLLNFINRTIINNQGLASSMFKFLFIVFISLGTVSLFVLVSYFMEWEAFDLISLNPEKYKDFIAPFGILLGSQIAGLAVYRNIIHSNEMKNKELKEERENTNKVLCSYFSHLYDLSKELYEDLESLRGILALTSVIKKDKTPVEIKYHIEQIKEEIKFINKTMETMLSASFSKNSDFGISYFLLNQRGTFIGMLHTVQRYDKDFTFNDILEDIDDMMKYLINFNCECSNNSKSLLNQHKIL